MMTKPHDDLSDLIGAPARQAKIPPANFKPAAERAFTEPCDKCRGSGQFRTWSGRAVGPCFTCKGTGKLTFKTSRDQRQKARASAAARKAAAAAEEAKERLAQVEKFKTEHPARYQWMVDSAPTFGFAASMVAALAQYGSLTDNQLTAIDRCIAGRAKAAANQAERAAAAPEIAMTKIEEAFASARENGIKRPRLRLDTFTFKPAPDHSKNAGSIYVTEGEGYLGKVASGKFHRARDCSDDQQVRILAAAADPAAAAKAYGLRTGSCSCCGRELTNGESIDLGIGPICAGHYGWA